MVWYYPPSTSSRGRGASAAASASASDHDSREEDDPEISLPAEKRRKHSGRRVNTTATPTTTTTTTTATTSLKADVAGTQDLSSEQVVDTPEITNVGDLDPHRRHESTVPQSPLQGARSHTIGQPPMLIEAQPPSIAVQKKIRQPRGIPPHLPAPTSKRVIQVGCSKLAVQNPYCKRCLLSS